MATLLAEPAKTASVSAFNEDILRDALRDAKNSGIAQLVADDDEFILMSRDEYNDRMNEAVLIGIADERLSNLDMSTLIPAEDVYRELGITQEELDAMPEVELE